MIYTNVLTMKKINNAVTGNTSFDATEIGELVGCGVVGCGVVGDSDGPAVGVVVGEVEGELEGAGVGTGQHITPPLAPFDSAIVFSSSSPSPADQLGTGLEACESVLQKAFRTPAHPKRGLSSKVSTTFVGLSRAQPQTSFVPRGTSS